MNILFDEDRNGNEEKQKNLPLLWDKPLRLT